MKIGIVTIFPEYFSGIFKVGMLRKALAKNLVSIYFENPRDYTSDSYRSVDDYSYGGGSGMVMKYEPLVKAIYSIKDKVSGPVIYLSPQGTRFEQRLAKALALESGFVLVCGRYEGIDERVLNVVDEEISIGDYVLSGGEPAAAVIVDAVVRLVPGVLGDRDSLKEETFEEGLLEYPHYTRPAIVDGMSVPDVLLSGNHGEIARWRRKEKLRRTLIKRPDLFKTLSLTEEDKKLIMEIKQEILDTLKSLGV